ncbi:MAG: hypothetical protein IPM29_14035 [Planctomycetes bacterium]|nr:hypothetical protein [Planctomycetota bacterium]
MRPQDIRVFKEVARDFDVWILVRETNEASLRWIGEPGFTPKPIDCKAKTADIGPLAGLVVDPYRRRDCISEARRGKARDCWADFEKVLRADRERRVPEWGVRDAPGDEFHGAVTFRGSYVHGDYDLKDVIDAEHFARNLGVHDTLRGQKHVWSPEYRRVRDELNRRLGIEMIQHGAEAQYADHSDEMVRLFAPQGFTATFHSARELRRFYEMHGRQTLTGQPSDHRGDPNWRPRILPGGRR